LIYFILMEEGDRGVVPKEAKVAGEAVLSLHGALLVTIGVMLD
jgi:hypothetical protein